MGDFVPVESKLAHFTLCWVQPKQLHSGLFFQQGSPDKTTTVKKFVFKCSLDATKQYLHPGVTYPTFVAGLENFFCLRRHVSSELELFCNGE